jgi:hypothetical protein
MEGSLVILAFPDPDNPSIAYVESAAGLDATAVLLEAIVSEI